MNYKHTILIRHINSKRQAILMMLLHEGKVIVKWTKMRLNQAKNK